MASPDTGAAVPDQSGTVPARRRGALPRWAPLALAAVASILLGRGCAALVDAAIQDARNGATAVRSAGLRVDGPLVDILPGERRRGEIAVNLADPGTLHDTIAAHSAARDPDLTDSMEIDVWAAPGAGCTDAPGPLLYSGRVTTLSIRTDSLPSGGGVARLCFTLRLPVPLGNEYQGATDDLGIVITPSGRPR